MESQCINAGFPVIPEPGGIYAKRRKKAVVCNIIFILSWYMQDAVMPCAKDITFRPLFQDRILELDWAIKVIGSPIIHMVIVTSGIIT